MTSSMHYRTVVSFLCVCPVHFKEKSVTLWQSAYTYICPKIVRVCMRMWAWAYITTLALNQNLVLTSTMPEV